MIRNAPWSFLVDALISAAMLTASAWVGKTHEGTVMTASQGSVMVETATAEVIFDVPPEASVRLDGQVAELSALQPGFRVVVQAEERDGRLVASAVAASSGDFANRR